ncbi:hypothetical protein FHS16_006395 [Paenibacillus endophyticus]|uniref:Uncharacterized protein n=1 Tax=Paenibacillus endophyticus TaxID=1294268 RepID=A0A7W5CEP4_9BACL|nr:hypothetical protein [Paenibacillus endophyticus]
MSLVAATRLMINSNQLQESEENQVEFLVNYLSPSD